MVQKYRYKKDKRNIEEEMKKKYRKTKEKKIIEKSLYKKRIEK